MLRYDFNTQQEYHALFSYLAKHDYEHKKAPDLSGMWGGWHVIIDTKNKTYFEAVRSHIGSTIQCKNFTEVIDRLEYRYYTKILWEMMMSYNVQQICGSAILDNRRILMAKF